VGSGKLRESVVLMHAGIDASLETHCSEKVAHRKAGVAVDDCPLLTSGSLRQTHHISVPDDKALPDLLPMPTRFQSL
jgi:hypothetical protein